MTEEEEILFRCNESELLWMARTQGLPLLRRGLPKEELVAIVLGNINPDERHLSNTNYTRMMLEKFVEENISRLYGQLPGCNGRCRSFKCSEGKHIACLVPSEPYLK